MSRAFKERSKEGAFQVDSTVLNATRRTKRFTKQVDSYLACSETNAAALSHLGVSGGSREGARFLGAADYCHPN